MLQTRRRDPEQQSGATVIPWITDRAHCPPCPSSRLSRSSLNPLGAVSLCHGEHPLLQTGESRHKNRREEECPTRGPASSSSSHHGPPCATAGRLLKRSTSQEGDSRGAHGGRAGRGLAHPAICFQFPDTGRFSPPHWRPRAPHASRITR